MPANFKTYEAQARLLAAVVAAHPGLRLDYKAISRHYGSDTTTSAIEHRFRPVKKQADVLRVLVQKNLDTKDVDVLNKDEIAKYFGESTPDGIQFQFRAIKKDADGLKNAVNGGENPAQAWATKNGSVPATPRKRGSKAATTPATKGSSGARTTSTSKRKVGRPNYKETSKDDSSTEVDYDELDTTPSKLIKKKIKTTPNITGIAPRFMPGAPEPAMSGALPAPVAAPVFTAAAPPAAVPAPAAPFGGSVPSPSFAQTPTDSDFSSVHTPTQHQVHAAAHLKPEPAFGFHLPDYGNDVAMSFLGNNAGIGGLNQQLAGFTNDFNFGDSDDEDNGEI